jgi:glutamate carboxypeptidase
VSGVAARIRAELDALVAVSSPSGDVAAAERLIELCQGFLGPWSFHRVPCSTPGCADDLIARLRGTGSRRLLLLGHLDTVVPHAEHRPLRAEGERLYGSGTADMKGGVAIALAVARALAGAPERFAELAVLLVCDEEWRTQPFRHGKTFAGYDACLCFEAGERDPDSGADAVIVRRKGAGTLRVHAHGRSAHSGSQPDRGRNALLALAAVAQALAARHDPGGPSALTVVPTVLRSGGALNVVPGSGELIVDLRSHDVADFAAVQAAVPVELDGVALEVVMERVWPAMDSGRFVAGLLQDASALLGRPVVARARGGASDASHLAPLIPLTVDGLGPRGGDAHNPGEFVLADSLAARYEVALAVARAALAGG